MVKIYKMFQPSLWVGLFVIGFIVLGVACKDKVENYSRDVVSQTKKGMVRDFWLQIFWEHPKRDITANCTILNSKGQMKDLVIIYGKTDYEFKAKSGWCMFEGSHGDLVNLKVIIIVDHVERIYIGDSQYKDGTVWIQW